MFRKATFENGLNKMKCFKLNVTIFIIGIIIIFSSCSVNTKPSKIDIIKAVTRNLQSNIPVSWVGNLLGGKKANIKTIEIVKIGIFNKENGYWPMKIRCVGSCELNDPFNQGKMIAFNRIGEFVLSKDDYGEWQADLRGGMFQ